MHEEILQTSEIILTPILAKTNLEPGYKISVTLTGSPAQKLLLYCIHTVTLYPRNKSKLSCVNLKIISPLKIKFFDSKIIMLNPPNYIRNGNYIKLNKYYIITYHRMTNETHVFLYTIISDIF